jgi:predicted dithiol-disulfide oxidoreductase (DUF899 family)
MRFPGESGAYRTARDALLAEEVALRRRSEEVAAMRRALPLGGKLAKDYSFTETGIGLGDEDGAGKSGDRVKLSELFAPGTTSLLLYNFMYPPGGAACPGCTAFLDGLHGSAAQIAQRVSLAVVAKAPPEAIAAWAGKRGWSGFRMLSSGGISFNADYLAESGDGEQLPLLHVFVKNGEGVFHAYSTELFFVPNADGLHPRHVDSLWPLWAALDLTPQGRGADWFPQLPD